MSNLENIKTVIWSHQSITCSPPPSDPPSKPGKPKATNWDKDFVDLEWAKPKDDGGAEITEYIIEKRDVVSRERLRDSNENLHRGILTLNSILSLPPPVTILLLSPTDWPWLGSLWLRAW